MFAGGPWGNGMLRQAPNQQRVRLELPRAMSLVRQDCAVSRPPTNIKRYPITADRSAQT